MRWEGIELLSNQMLYKNKFMIFGFETSAIHLKLELKFSAEVDRQLGM